MLIDTTFHELSELFLVAVAVDAEQDERLALHLIHQRSFEWEPWPSTSAHQSAQNER